MDTIKSPELNGAFNQIVESLANDVYEEFSQAYPHIPENPWAAPFCHVIAPRLQEKLTANNITVSTVEGGGGLDDIHIYLKTSDGLIIDPTWQQFIDTSSLTSDTPRTLIVNSDQLEDILSEHGIPNIVQALWDIPEKEDWEF